MKIRICSDLHLEFGSFDLPKHDDELETVLVLAGDIGLAKYKKTFLPFLEEMSDRFKAVVYVMGNHEYYRNSLDYSLSSMQKAIHNASLFNVFIMENDTLIVEDVAFVCATLWTDYCGNNPLAKEIAQRSLNDHRLIRIDDYNGGLFTAEVAYEKHLNSKDYIFGEIWDLITVNMKVVVVSHHCPSRESIPEKYRGPENFLLNGAFVSEMDEEILDTQPTLWIHGHTHDSFDYHIGSTRVICNPRGYKGSDLNAAFNPDLVIEI